MVHRHDAWIGAIVLAAAAVFGACGGSLGGLTARASDEWTRSYPLAANRGVQITNRNGSMEVEGVASATGDGRAERIARAATDAAARELLARIEIQGDSQP